MPVAEAPQPITAEQEAEWQAKIDAAFEGKTPVGKEPESEPMTLAQAVGAPEAMEDLWPGHVYIPPKLYELEIILPLAEQMESLFVEGRIWPAVECAIQIVQKVSRKADTLEEVSADEIKRTFDEDEIAGIIQHILSRQGLAAEPKPGNALSGSRTGWKSFQRSAAIIPLTLSSEQDENSPSPSSSD